nr:capsid assembly protein [uncultured Mediterranean phage uvMED]
MDQTTANAQSDTQQEATVLDQSQPPQEQQVDFQSLIPEDYKEEKSLQNFSNMDDFVKSYLHSQKLVGADKIPVPNKMATDEDWKAVYDRLGRPETPDGYKYDLPKETKLEESTLKAFSEEAHKLGLLPKQAEGIINYYNSIAEQTEQAATVNEEAAKAEAEVELRKEYGPAYDLKIAQARNLATNTFGQDFLRDTKLADGSILGNHPQVVRAFANLASQMSEDGIVQGEATSAMTVKEIDGEIESLTQPGSAYWDKTHINHRKAVGEVQRLYELKNQS